MPRRPATSAPVRPTSGRRWPETMTKQSGSHGAGKERDDGHVERIQRIVVGVDASKASSEALEWAADVAAHRDATLTAVFAWTLPLTFTIDPIDEDALHAQAQKYLAEAVATVEIPHKVKVEQLVAHGDPAAALLAAARDADLLVVGSRGRGGFAGLLLGSVGAQVASHAKCTVMIVRAPPAEGAD